MLLHCVGRHVRLEELWNSRARPTFHNPLSVVRVSECVTMIGLGTDMENDFRQNMQDDRGHLRQSVAAFDATKSSSSSFTRPNDHADHQSIMATLLGAMERNPLIALTAAATLTAIVVIALKPSRQPKSKLRVLEQRAIRQAKETERQLKSALNRSGVPNGVENLVGAFTTRLSSLDANRLEALCEQAMSMLNRTVQQIRR